MTKYDEDDHVIVVSEDCYFLEGDDRGRKGVITELIESDAWDTEEPEYEVRFDDDGELRLLLENEIRLVSNITGRTLDYKYD